VIEASKPVLDMPDTARWPGDDLIERIARGDRDD
jgi:hypothetical protein